MIEVGAISRLAAAGLLAIPIVVCGLGGLWLLVSSSARRSLMLERGGVEHRRRDNLEMRLNHWLVSTRHGALLAERLRSGGTDLTPARFMMMVAAVSIGVFLIASLMFPPLLAVAGGVLAGWGCFVWLEQRLDKRREQFVAQLPEVARLLSNGASAGLSMPAAIELAVREIDAPASEELQTVVDELTYGRSLDEALGSLQRRLPSREIAVLMTTLVIQQRSGGDVVRALHDLSTTLDDRRNTLREVRTIMAGAIYTAYIVPLLGVGSLFLLNLIDSSTLTDMTSKPLGIAVLVIAAVLYAMGWVAIRKTTRIEV